MYGGAVSVTRIDPPPARGAAADECCEPDPIGTREPGLDAGSARVVKNVLRERVAAGGTVIMTTHILEVAERMADRIGVIDGGRLIAEGTLDELHHKTGKTAASLEDTFLTLVAEPAAPPVAAE